ncbi:MAG: lysophospholipid acyltransferase family protein [Planctomycetota bacterium]|jgi:1-acyl-sn-glycerol-3-phosphate acyltransferase
MNIQPYQTPPKWWSPKLTPWVVRAARPFRRRLLRRTQRIVDLQIRGAEYLNDALATGAGVLITPNHSSHTDPAVILEATQMPLYFMAAWQVFAQANILRQHIFRLNGCFSVDREGADMRAFRQAVEILQEKTHPLVIFAEGEVYHVNDTVTPFQDGPAAMAITAQRRGERDVVCIPCAMKFKYATDPTPELSELMSRLERQILWRPTPDKPLAERIYRFAEGILGVKEVEYMGHAQSGTLPERVKDLAVHVLESIESRYSITPDTDRIPARVKVCRREIIKQMETADGEMLKQMHIDLDDLFMVIQLYSYPGDYVDANPTLERMAETLDKFEEDILGAPTATIRASRTATVAFGEPIDAKLASGKKQTVAALTEKLEQGVQNLLNEM